MEHQIQVNLVVFARETLMLDATENVDYPSSMNSNPRHHLYDEAS